jgi:hypothetical protein
MPGPFLLRGKRDVRPYTMRWSHISVWQCRGRQSFITGRYSVYNDHMTKLTLRVPLKWDFSSGALHRPKVNSTFYNRASLSSTISLALRRRNEPSTLHLPFDGSAGVTYHPAPPRSEVSLLQPIQVCKHYPILSSNPSHVFVWYR